MQSVIDSVCCMENAADLALISHDFNGQQAQPFWNVYNHVATNWYAQEHGQIEQPDRWYHPAMIFLEAIASGWTPQRALDYIAPWGINAR